MPNVTVADGTSLYFRQWGEGTPTLFLSSLGCGSRLWDYQFAALADHGVACIGLDRRGHGRSEEAASGYDFDTLADDVATLIEKLDVSGVTLVAHSMAGGEIVRYLSRHGAARVARIVLIAPTTPRLLHAEDHPAGLPREAFEQTWAGWRQDYPKWVADNLAPFFIPETSRAMMDWGATLLQASVPVALACARATAEADFREEMRRIAVPTLIIHGDRDRSAPIELTGRPSAELIAGAQLEIYRDAPHGLMFTHGDRLHADLLRFVRGA